MRHRKAGIKLGRTGSHRNAMFRNMVTSLFKHGKIKTTDPKAKELRRWADHLVTLAKRGDLHARRQALAVVREKSVVHKLFEEARGQFGDRVGGYTRLTKLGIRRGDGAPMTLVELITAGEDEQKKKDKKGKKVQKPMTATASSALPKEDAKAETSSETEVPASEETAVSAATAPETMPKDAAASASAPEAGEEPEASDPVPTTVSDASAPAGEETEEMPNQKDDESPVDGEEERGE